MAYAPVISAAAPPLHITALAGTTTVVLGFDLAVPVAPDLLGFAVCRTDLATGRAEWLKNPLKFAHEPYTGYQVAGTDARHAPFQQFHWIDEGVQPDHVYRYTVATVVGTPAQPTLGATCDLDLRTAAVAADGLGLIFNRGITATPAYRTQFDNRAIAAQPPALRAPAAAYLSRGLRESLLSFLGATAAGDRLDIAIYEFQDAEVVTALHAALDRGVVVRVVAHARADHAGQANAPFLKQLAQHSTAELSIVRRTRVPALSHNKLVVHTVQGVPTRVWCGSTNFTEQGFFRQTNVGIVLDDPALARAYAAYVELLAADPPAEQLRPAVRVLVEASPAGPRQVFFAPSDHDAMLDAAVAAIASARDVVLISCPFGLDARLAAALDALDPRVLVYGVLNTNQSGDLAVINRDSRQHSLFVLPAWIEQLNGASYDASTGRGNQIHVKSLVVDPWGSDPTVLIGSANFSDESVFQNDENALLLRGDRRAAAIVATEFLRVFAHYRFRDRLKLLAQPYDTKPLPGQGSFLAEDDTSAPVWLVPPDEVGADGARVLGVKIDELWLDERGSWYAPYFDPAHPRCRERAAFVAG